MTLPDFALAVRQPWAWAIIYGGKDVENRTLYACVKGGMKRMRIAIYASLGMTRDEYNHGADYINYINGGGAGPMCPPAADLLRGGIIGAVTVIDIVHASSSPWFVRQRRGRGLVLTDAKPCDFVGVDNGQLGYFRPSPADPIRLPAPAALWMTGQTCTGRQVVAKDKGADKTGDLFA